MRNRKTLINVAFSVLLEIVSILSGFVIPSCIIHAFGSDVNGLTQSYSSFMGYISILQLGAGSVIKAVLYVPLAKNDNEKLSVIAKTSSNFFFKIGLVGLIYMCVLAVLFPLVIRPEYGFAYSFSLVVIISIGIIAQYMFGITYQMILEADQKSYIYAIAQIITIILNAISTILLTRMGLSIQIVKLFSSAFFILRPLLLSVYVRKKYNINSNVKSDSSVIAQRWNGFAHGLAYFIHSKTDVFVLTLFSDMKSVSVYSVYSVITTGLTAFISRIDVVVRAKLGYLFASGDNKKLKYIFDMYSTLLHIFSCICFSTAVISASRFINLYVNNVSDANYNQPLFATLIISAEFIYCLRMPYNSIVFVANKFRDTKNDAFIEAGINIIISCALVPNLGLVGVALGTIFAMTYRTVAFVLYLKKNILMLSIKKQIKRFSISLLCYVLSIVIGSLLKSPTNNYFQWIGYALIVFLISASTIILVNLILDRQNTIEAMYMLLGKNRKRQEEIDNE